MNYAFLEHWHDFLPREGGHVVVFHGGGGKTALLEAVAGTLTGEGVPVAVTGMSGWVCPDRSGPDEAGPRLVPFAELADGDDTGDLLIQVVSAVGAPDAGLTSGQIDRLGELAPARVVLCECDAGSGRSAVLPAGSEPSLPARTSLAVSVIGLDGVGTSPRKAVLGWERLPEDWLSGDDGDKLWDWDGVVALLGSSDGMVSRVAADVPRAAALLQMDACNDSIGLFACLARVMAASDLPLVVLGDTSGAEPRLRTAYTLPDEAPV